jgi:hypothetical protein
MTKRYDRNGKRLRASPWDVWVVFCWESPVFWLTLSVSAAAGVLLGWLR